MDTNNSASTPQATQPLAPVGGIVFASDPIVFNTDRNSVKITVRNTGDRPIQVGSHFHFFEVNRALEFDREAAFGKHLDIASTTAVRFEPGDEKEVSLVDFAGKMFINGFNGLVNSWAGGDSMSSYHPARTEAMRRVREFGFKDSAHE